MGLSILTHGALLAWLIFLWPAAEIHIPTGDEPLQKEMTATPEQLQHVALEIEKTQADEIRRKVEELLETQRRLNEAEAQKQAELAALANEQAADAPQKTREALDAVAKAQAEAVKAERETVDAAAEFARATAAGESAGSSEEKSASEANAAREKLAKLQQKAKDAQYAASAAQANAVQQLGMQEDPAVQEAKKTQTEAQAAQKEANLKQDAAVVQTTQIEALKKTADRVEGLSETAQRKVDESRAAQEKTEKSIAELEAGIEEQKQALTELEKAAASAKEKQEQAASEKDKKSASEEAGKAAKTVKKAETTLAATEKKLESARKSREKLQAQIKSDEEKAAGEAAKAEKAQAALKQAPEKIEQAQKQALEAQQKAQELQTSAQSAIVSALTAAPATAQSQPQPGASQPPPEGVPPMALEGKSLAELYQLGVETENKIAETYQNIRAADVAALRQIPLAEARRFVEVARPARPDLAAGLAQSDVSNAGELDAKKETIEKALQEVESMVGQSRGMLAQTAATAKGGGTTISSEGLRAAVSNANMLAAVATDRQDGNKTADLTTMMKQIEGGSAAGGEVAKPAGKNGGDGGGATGAPGTSSSGWSSSLRGEAAPPMGPLKESLPGRKVHGAGTAVAGGAWMYLDTWYVIGPFPNANRKNIDTKFPPETVVNLDGVYPGQDNKALRWQFIQTDQPRLRPPLERPYAIYYAYTTLWFDEARDLWIGVGSDDFSKVWINDMLVWASGPQQKEWRPDEGFRKVHFRKGLNRVLYRIENGQSGCSFSLMLAANKGD